MPLTYAWWKCLLNEREELETLDDAGILVSQPLGLRFMGEGRGNCVEWSGAGREPRDPEMVGATRGPAGQSVDGMHEVAKCD